MVDSKVHGHKMPVKQLTILAIARFSEPLALTSVFPYLPEMILSFGVEKDRVARWAGLIGAIFSFAQSLTAVPWGIASDHIGRKPVIVMGLLSTMACFLIWGMTTSLTMAIIVRFIQGAGNGNVGIIRTMVAEMVTVKEHQPRAFSIMPIVWSVGSIFGPAFGGFFARPADQFPDLFGDSAFFQKYPFFLPNLVLCLFFTISVSTAYLFLKETLASKRHAEDWGLKLGEKLTRPFRRSKRVHRHRASFVDGEATAPLLPPRGPPGPVAASSDADSEVPVHKPRMWDMFTRRTTIDLICYAFLSAHAVAFDQLLPVFLNYPRLDLTPDNSHLPFRWASGFGLRSDKIGTIFTLNGLVCGIIQFFVFPPLCNRFGVLRCYRVAACIFPVVYFLTPFSALAPTDQGRFAVLLLVMLVKSFATITAFPCIIILITNSATTPGTLGTLNGLATTISGIGRCLGPALSGTAFTWGVERGYIIVGWSFLALISALGAISTFFITEGAGLEVSEPDSDSDSDSDADEEEDGPYQISGPVPGGVGPHEAVHDAVPPVVSKPQGGKSGAGYGTIS